MARHMLSVGLDSFDTCVKLARLCEKYKLVIVDAHLSDEAFDRFETEFDEVMNK